MYGVLALVVPFYMLFARTGYLSIYRYFRQRLGYSCWRSFTGTYRNHFVFGQVVLDRFAVFAGRGDRFEVVVRGEEHFTRLSNGERGFIIAGSHVGNFEIAGYLLDASVKRVNALVFPGETRTMQEGRAGVLGRRNTRLVPVEEDMSHLFLARAALGAGEIVSMSCDRLSGSSRGVTCDFLGGRATFPAGPFALAVHAGVEVLSVFVLKEGWRRYAVHVRPTCGEVPEGATRGERVEALARAFAGELEAIVRRYPTQWFNYYRFWKDQ
jgi:predicted LPLAT superfamily acyltransferase